MINVPSHLINKDIFMKNVSNPNSNIILKEKYFSGANPQIEYLNELFDDNFLKDNERLVFNYYENKRISLKSSFLEKASNNANNNNNSSLINHEDNSSTKYISGMLNNSNINRKSVSSMNSKSNMGGHKKNLSMGKLNII